MAAPQFRTGVIEGFYGQPWSQAERLHLFRNMPGYGLNTYLYAPKDDLKHRALWRARYDEAEAERLGELVRACGSNLEFIYGIGPGLDIRYSDPADLDALKSRFAQLLQLGCQSFALLFDDIPDAMRSDDAAHFNSFADAHVYIANEIYRWLAEQSRQPRLLFCPTPYCGRMAARQLGGANYLDTIGRDLLPEIGIFWTGPEIISERITVAHLRDLRSLLRRKPLIWDNLHANDYDGRRFYAGPYSGRELGLRDEVSGILSNPNNEYPLNFVAFRTLGRFTRAAEWDDAAQYAQSLAEWLPSFETVRGQTSLEHLRAFADCFYLPHSDGREANALFEALQHDPAEARRRIRQLKEFCAAAPELKNRELFNALSRRVWDLREELDLLERYLDWRDAGANTPFQSDFHLPGTYRGGFVSKLQELLKLQPDGTIQPRL
jgi:protein O-GlcNAcase / histone acetyltransferase